MKDFVVRTDTNGFHWCTIPVARIYFRWNKRFCFSHVVQDDKMGWHGSSSWTPEQSNLQARSGQGPALTFLLEWWGSSSNSNSSPYTYFVSVDIAVIFEKCVSIYRKSHPQHLCCPSCFPHKQIIVSSHLCCKIVFRGHGLAILQHPKFSYRYSLELINYNYRAVRNTRNMRCTGSLSEVVYDRRKNIYYENVYFQYLIFLIFDDVWGSALLVVCIFWWIVLGGVRKKVQSPQFIHLDFMFWTPIGLVLLVGARMNHRPDDD